MESFHYIFSKVTHFQSSKSNIYGFSSFFVHSHSFIDRNKKSSLPSLSLSLSIFTLDVLEIKSSARNKAARSPSKGREMKGDSIGTSYSEEKEGELGTVR